MSRCELLREASILEELNKQAGKYVSFQQLLTVVKNRPLLTRTVVKLQNYGHVERGEQGAKITESGQEALVRYRRIKNLVEQVL